MKGIKDETESLIPRLGLNFLMGLLISALTCTTVWAQSTAQMSGTVTDQSGARLPGVEVTATQTSTGVARAVVTNETGSYVLPNLPIGPYRLEAGACGVGVPGCHATGRHGKAREYAYNGGAGACGGEQLREGREFQCGRHNPEGLDPGDEPFP